MKAKNLLILLAALCVSMLLSSCSTNKITLEQFKEKIGFNQILKDLYLDVSTYDIAFYKVESPLEEEKLSKKIRNEYFKELAEEVNFVEVVKYTKDLMLHPKQEYISSILEVNREDPFYVEIALKNKKLEYWDKNLTPDMYPFIKAHAKEYFDTHEKRMIDYLYQIIEEKLKGEKTSADFDFYLRNIEEAREVYAWLEVDMPSDTQKKLDTYKDKLNAAMGKPQTGEMSEAERQANIKKMESQYASQVKAYLVDIGREVTTINKELNNFSNSSRLPKALNNLQDICGKLKVVFVPNDKFNTVDDLLDLGADEYIMSAGTIAKAVTSLSEATLDQGVAQSKQAGDYFKQALDELKSLGY